jgi:catecholate siderophore receptor
MSQQDRSALPAFLALGCVGFISSAQPAFAQDAKPPETLGRVTVTDTEVVEDSYRAEALSNPRFTEPLIDTPRSVTVLPESLLRQTATTSLSDALRFVPGVTLGAGEGGNPQGDRPFIRGFDAQGSTYIDGIRSVGGQSREVFAVEAIEVVKGSDSAIGGRGGAGGSINLVSKRPHLGNDVRVEGSLGNASYKRLTADANYQLGETSAVRLNAMWHDQDVAGRDAMSYSRWGFAPSVALGLGTPTQISIGWYHLQSDDLPDPGIPFERTQAQAIASGKLDIGPATEVNGQEVPRSAFYGLANRDFRKTDVDELHVRFSHELSDSVTAMFNAKYANVQQQYIISQPDDSQGNVQNGLVWRRANSRWADVDSFVLQQDFSGSFETGSIRHNFSAGGEYAWEQSKRGSFVSAAGNVAINTSPRCTPAGIVLYNCTSLFNPNPNDPWVNLVNNVESDIVRSPITGNNTATTWSLYAFDTVHFSDKLLLNLGGRYDNYRQRAIAASSVTGVPTSNLFVKDDFLSYQLGLGYKPLPNGSIYASTGTSVIPPGSFVGEGSEGNSIGTSTTITLDDLKAERTTSYEIGTKWDLMEGGLSLAAAVFRTETKNARITNAQGYLEYVGHRRVTGIELSATGRPLPFWNLFAGYTLMDSELVSAGENATPATLAGVGKVFPNTPRNSFTAQTDFTFAERFTVGGGAIYNSRQYGSFGVGGVTRSIDPYWRVDLNASARITENIEVRVNAQNLLNERYYDRTYTTHFVNQAPGRTVIGTLSISY